MKTTLLLSYLLPAVGLGLVVLDARKAAAASAAPIGPILTPNPTTGTGTGSTQGRIPAPRPRLPWPGAQVKPPMPANVRTALTILLGNFGATAAQLNAGVKAAQNYTLNLQEGQLVSRLQARAIAAAEQGAFTGANRAF